MEGGILFRQKAANSKQTMEWILRQILSGLGWLIVFFLSQRVS